MCVSCLVLLLAAFAAPSPLHASTLADGVLSEVNRVRADPQGYARELRSEQVAGGGAMAQEDPKAVADAIDDLSHEQPLPALARDALLATAAQSYAARQGPTGEVGHGPPGSLRQRLKDAGVVAKVVGESISYGERTSRGVVRQLIIDSGVPDRAHRKILLDRAFDAAGVGCGGHAEYGVMCVIDLAGGRK
jgi:uncharacterized protein YkwD